MMTRSIPTVFIVDDNPSVRRSLERLVRSAGFRAETFASGKEFLARKSHDGPSCAVLDVRMPGLSGMDLQKELIREGIPLPVIFITGHGNIPMSVEAMKGGAVDFLPKPFSDKDLLAAIDRAVDKDARAREEEAEKAGIRKRLAALTPREHDVMLHVIAGMLNKQIAARLNIAEKTVKVHRGRVMQKMQAVSVAELVRMTQRCGITPPEK